MYVPPLPTDNLYKFLALSGVALILACLILLSTSLRELSIAVIETQTRYQVLQLETDALEVEYSRLRKDGSDDPGTLVALRNKSLEISIKGAELAGEAQKQTELNSQARRMLDYATIAMLAGLVISVVGFILWYLRVQKPADALIIKQLFATTERA